MSGPSGRDAGPLAVLIGPMAAGKTTVGRRLAALRDVPFADLDQEIEIREGRSISAIFAADGEAAFRAAETATLRDLLATHPGVLALGGGAPIQPENQHLLQGHTVVLLEIDEATAARRLRGGAGRPMLAGRDPVRAWRGIREQRLPIYRGLARYLVDASAGGSDATARRIDRLLPRKGP
ncbi:MAG: shikimate kinase [Brachybacterium sp.]|nr:shikimate kinase [Brachybacterium sp.]